MDTELTTVENSNGERQIIQVIREPIEGSVAIAAAKEENTIYEFGQPQYIAIPNNALSNIQVNDKMKVLPCKVTNIAQ